jgi:hypothetical protein
MKTTILFKAMGLAALTVAMAACGSDGGGGKGNGGGDSGPTTDAGPTTHDSGPTGHDMGTCTAGAEGCPCGAMAPCPDGQTCTDGQCQDIPMQQLGVSDPAARACELYLRESGDSKVASVQFGMGVRGKMLRQAPGVAVVFIRQEDSAFPAGSLSLGITGPAAGVTLASSSCTDRLGRPLPGAQVTLH